MASTRRPTFVSIHDGSRQNSLFEQIADQVRLTYLNADSRFETRTAEHDGWLMSLVNGRGVVDLGFTADGLSLLKPYTALIYIMSGVITNAAGGDLPIAKFGQLILFRPHNEFHIRVASEFRYLIVFFRTAELI